MISSDRATHFDTDGPLSIGDIESSISNMPEISTQRHEEHKGKREPAGKSCASAGRRASGQKIDRMVLDLAGPASFPGFEESRDQVILHLAARHRMAEAERDAETAPRIRNPSGLEAPLASEAGCQDRR